MNMPMNKADVNKKQQGNEHFPEESKNHPGKFYSNREINNHNNTKV